MAFRRSRRGRIGVCSLELLIVPNTTCSRLKVRAPRVSWAELASRRESHRPAGIRAATLSLGAASRVRSITRRVWTDS
jgi:hypothetical protein